MILPRGARDRPRAPKGTRKELEADYQAKIIQLAHTYGWRTMHVRAAPAGRNDQRRSLTATSVAGWPDLTCWRGPRLIHIEVKGHDGRLRPEQGPLLDELNQAVEAYVTWPWEYQAVAQMLARRTI